VRLRTARARVSRNRRPRPRRASCERPSPRLASLKRSPRPSPLPCCHSPFRFCARSCTRKPQLPSRRSPGSAVLLSARAAVFESVFPRGELRRAPLLPPVLSILYFMAVWALFTCVRELWLPGTASAASALSSGRRIGLGEFPFTPANSWCLRFFDPWPIDPNPRAPVTSLPPAMVPHRRKHCSRPSASFLSPPSLFSAVHRMINGPERPIPLRRGKIAKEPLGFQQIMPTVPQLIKFEYPFYLF